MVQLAHFRQQRAKGNSANAVKKNTRKKIPTFRANDRSAQDESRPEHLHELDGKDEPEVRFDYYYYFFVTEYLYVCCIIDMILIL